MTKIRLLQIGVFVATFTWFGLEQHEVSLEACNDYYCGTQAQCGTLDACCIGNGGTGLDLCDVSNGGHNCDAHSPC